MSRTNRISLHRTLPTGLPIASLYGKRCTTMIERRFDIPLVAALALREKQIQQNYRPLIAVHKWFARRPGTLFRGLILSEFVDRPLRESFYESHDLQGIRIADPFMGGGTPLLEANRVGCDVSGCDINPMAYWIVREEIEHLDLVAYRLATAALREELEGEIGPLYRTACVECGSHDAHAKYFLWVKTIACRECGEDIRLFPGYLVAQDRRHPRNVFVCKECGSLSESESRDRPGKCGECGSPLGLQGPAKRGRCLCPRCSASNAFPRPEDGPPRHSMFAIEYYCPGCRTSHEGRFFKAPDPRDQENVRAASRMWEAMPARFVPTGAIPKGDETDRLHRWGYRRYAEMFNTRQILGLELSCRFIASSRDARVRNALATNLSDLLRYQNMLCRYDPMALKSLDVFSVHGFPVGLIACESNLLGIPNGPSGGNVGSGGWSNIVEKYARAKAYCAAPFEYRHDGRRKVRVDFPGEWIGDRPNGRSGSRDRLVNLVCADAGTHGLGPGPFDAVLTDPPYFGNVQYAELMDFCYVWLRKLANGVEASGIFEEESTRNVNELTGNFNMGRDLAHFTEGLSLVFQKTTESLRPGSPLAFTFHHNDMRAYLPVAVALLDAGLACTASLPCPAEMGASIHISGTGSSIIDTVFVCRSTGRVPKRWLTRDPETVGVLVREDLDKLREGGVKPTKGDARCVAYGHVTRLAIWYLRRGWRRDLPVDKRIAAVAAWIENELGGAQTVLSHLSAEPAAAPVQQWMVLHEARENYAKDERQISF